MSKELRIFNNEDFEVKVKNNNGVFEFDAENVSRNLGITTVAKSGNEVVRWNRVNNYLKEFSHPQVAKGDFIHEQYVYLLAMKANNKVAVEFQKWLAFEVLPMIREKGGYITANATDKQVDELVRLSTPQRRRKALEEATIDGKDNVFTVYEDILDYIKNWSADKKVTALRHVERVLDDKKESYGTDIAFVVKVEELLVTVAKEIDKIRNYSYAANMRHLNQENKQLERQLEANKELTIDDYFVLDYHPFSVNYQFEAVKSFDNKPFVADTSAYSKWKRNFPSFSIPNKKELNVDFNKPVKVYLMFDHLDKFDVTNFEKSFIDELFLHFQEDDKVVYASNSKTNRYVDTYDEGKIYYYLENL